ncbi:basic secretory family protein [Rhodococcus sp. BS-15]|uniref:basic secretory family protein n=1 Tax=Rhodococcus sp. BS-15 TaxID=1304954 RepID=UPI000B2AC638|nr:basic secretory family protein [Rhodococcus sp. BS-15]
MTVSDAVAGDGSRPTGQRVVFGPDAASRLTPFTVRSVLRHELTHVAARAQTSDGTELWVSEGFADYSGYRNSGAEFAQLAPTLAAIVAAGGPPTVLPKNEDFGAGGARSSVAYESAWSVFAFVADRFGESTLRTLYEALASESNTDAAFASVLGMSRAQFVAAWGDWVALQAR